MHSPLASARPGRPAGRAPRACRSPLARLPRACPVFACRARPNASRPSAPPAPAARLAVLQRPAPCRSAQLRVPSAYPCCIATQAYPKLTIQFVLQYKPAAHQIVLQYSFFSSQAGSIAIHVTLLQYNFSPLLCNRNQCIAIHFQPILGASLQYNFLYCNTISILLKPSSLQYNDCIAIQFPFLLQYNWAVAHSNFCTIFFLFFIILYIIFNYFQQLEKSQKKNHFSFFFIFLDTQ